MQRKLVEKNGISSEFALELHDRAEKIAHDTARLSGHDYADDEIATELEALVVPYLVERNLADQNEFKKMEKLIMDWYPPNHFTAEQIKKCALVQQILLGFLKNYPEMIEEKFQVISMINMHEGWKGLAVSKRSNENKIPDLVRSTLKIFAKTPPEAFSFAQKEAMVNSVVKEATNKVETNDSFFSIAQRDETTLAYYKLLKDWHRFTIYERAMQIENILHVLDESLGKKKSLEPKK